MLGWIEKIAVVVAPVPMAAAYIAKKAVSLFVIDPVKNEVHHLKDSAEEKIKIEVKSVVNDTVGGVVDTQLEKINNSPVGKAAAMIVPAGVAGQHATASTANPADNINKVVDRVVDHALEKINQSPLGQIAKMIAPAANTGQELPAAATTVDATTPKTPVPISAAPKTPGNFFSNLFSGFGAFITGVIALFMSFLGPLFQKLGAMFTHSGDAIVTAQPNTKQSQAQTPPDENKPLTPELQEKARQALVPSGAGSSVVYGAKPQVAVQGITHQ